MHKCCFFFLLFFKLEDLSEHDTKFNFHFFMLHFFIWTFVTRNTIITFPDFCGEKMCHFYFCVLLWYTVIIIFSCVIYGFYLHVNRFTHTLMNYTFYYENYTHILQYYTSFVPKSKEITTHMTFKKMKICWFKIFFL